MGTAALVFCFVASIFSGYALGWAIGTNWQMKRLLPDLNDAREEVSRIRLLARLKGVDL